MRDLLKLKRSKQRLKASLKGGSSQSRIFASLFLAEPLERIEIVKSGVPANVVVDLAKTMSMSKDRLFGTLGLARATVDRKVRDNKPLSSDEGSRVLGMARLVGQVQTMIEESGNPANFNAAEWLANWLVRPLPALGGRPPAEFMDTPDGQSLVSDLVARMQSGSYA